MTLRPFNFIDKGPGLVPALEEAGIFIANRSDGWVCSDPAAAEAIIASYNPLPTQKAEKQAALDKFFDEHFELARFIREGTATNVTGTQVGTFLANVTNRYRTLRASIAAAADQGALDAINIATGWPSNP